MKSNYKPIGNHIRLVDERNKGLQVQHLLGLSISKKFIPSVANIIGTDMENYKIIRKNQFACSTMQVRRDKKMPVALLKDLDEAIISQAYPIFEVKGEKELLPEYLMMWFERVEFDREACFHAVGGVRGSLEWEDFESMQIPIPHIDKQREIVNEYNIIQNRIALNQQLIQKLEETAQAIYKQWFVEFEFPDENGKPYKSNGGEMVWCEELGKEIPKGWELKHYEQVFNFKTGKLNSDAAISDGEFPFFTCSQETFKTNTFAFDCEALILAGNNASAIYPFKYFEGKFDAYQRTYIITPKESFVSIYQGYFEILGRLEEFKGTSSGTATKFLTMQILNPTKIIEPEEQVYMKYSKICRPIFKGKLLAERNISSLTKLKELLLSKLATVN
jgi:type I restriction enzyme S subunit